MPISPELLSQFADALKARRDTPAVDAAATPQAEPQADQDAEVNDAPEATETPEADKLDFQVEDPADPPEIVEKKKNLERGFTQARQKDAEKIRAMEEKLKELEHKAHAFDILSESEDPASVIKGIRGDKQADAASPQTLGASFAIPKEAADAFDEGTVKGILAIVQAGQQHLLEQLAPYKQLIESIGLEKYQTQWSQLDAEFPGASAHKAEVEKYAQAHGLPMRQALLALKGEDLVANKMKVNLQKQKRAELTNTSVTATPAAVKPTATQKYDKKNLAQQIIRQAKELGIQKFQH